MPTVRQPLAKAEPPAPPRRRRASRDERRRQFIEATITTIARNGYARTTLTDVARSAGLSHGLVIFHFGTKEALLADTLVYLADEYRHNWISAHDAAPAEPAARLEAMIRADFNEVVCASDRLAAWSAFWGESRFRPLYQQACEANDRDYNGRVEQLCRELVAEGSYAIDAGLTARAIRILLDGLWLDIVSRNSPDARHEALATAMTTVRAFFPAHFPAA